MDVIVPSAYFGSPLIAVRLSCISTGIDDHLQTTNTIANIFPNPSNTNTTIQFNSIIKNGELGIYNSKGQKVRTINGISGPDYKLHRENLPSGLYFISLSENNRLLATEKIIIAD